MTPARGVSTLKTKTWTRTNVYVGDTDEYNISTYHEESLFTFAPVALSTHSKPFCRDESFMVSKKCCHNVANPIVGEAERDRETAE